MKQTLLFACVALLIHRASADVTFDLHIIDDNTCYGCNYAIGDIDRDGKNDIVGTTNGQAMYWLKYPDLENRIPIHGSGTEFGFEFYLADVDVDGDSDVITSGGGLTWLENPGDGQGTWNVHEFGSYGNQGGEYNWGSHDFRCGDINADGKVDAIERMQGSGEWMIYIQQTPGSWTTKTLGAHVSGEGTCLGDVDGDGDLDVSDGWAWYECPGSPSGGNCDPTGNWAEHEVGNPSHNLTRVRMADINEDGHLDIISSPSEYGGQELDYFEAPADPKNGSWIKHTLVSYGDPNFHTLQIGDIDRDGHLDIFVGSTHGQCSVPKLLWIFYNVNGDGSDWSVQQKWNAQDGAWQGTLGDVGSDGDLDIVTADYESNTKGEYYENKLDPVRISGRRQSSGTTLERSIFVQNQGGIIELKTGMGKIADNDVAVADVAGRTLSRSRAPVSIAGQTVGVKILEVPAGAYFLRITSPRRTVVIPFAVPGR
jgi:hypothetical protein